MDRLSETWFVEGYIDFEMKKYTLLAYLQKVNALFSKQKLYPQMSELVAHYNNLISVKEGKKKLQETFPKKLSGIELEKLRLLYDEIVQDDKVMDELLDIIQYSLGKMGETLETGKDIYNGVEQDIEIIPVGIQPLDNSFGYFFLSSGGSVKNTNIYSYQLSIFEKSNDKYRGLMTQYLYSHKRDLANTYENIKIELLKSKKNHEHPAVYAIETEVNYPEQETLLPIAKRQLIKYVSE